MMSAAGWNRMLTLCLLALVFGCQASTRPVVYYTLNTLTSPDEAKDRRFETAPIAIGIGPLELPAYLERPQIVTRIGPNRLKVDDFHRWASPLQDDMLRIVVNNLKMLSGSRRIVTYPWSMEQKPDIAVSVQVYNFEGFQMESVVLQATLILNDLRSGVRPVRRDISMEQKADISDYDALVAAQSMLLADLSRTIAEAIAGLSP